MDASPLSVIEDVTAGLMSDHLCPSLRQCVDFAEDRPRQTKRIASDPKPCPQQVMSPWSPPGPEPGTDSAPAQASTPGAGFLPRLDYYLKLAEGPVLPHEGSPDVEGSLGGLSRADTPMVDPQLEPMLHPDGGQLCTPQGVPDSATSNNYGRLHSLPTGQTVFYGPTSLLKLYPPATSSWSSAEHPTTVPRETLLSPDQKIIEQQLTDEYFLYDNLFLPKFTKELYLNEKDTYENGGQSQLYSPALGHAM